MLPIIILLRVLFVASMVFIIGYVFGSFSKNPVLTSITRVAAILAIVLFISSNILAFRGGGWRRSVEGKYQCGYVNRDSSTVQPKQMQ